MAANTIDSANTASGFEALSANDSGAFNAATGTYALRSNTTGSENTASGYAALYQNTTSLESNWEGIWLGAATRDEEGWTAEMASWSGATPVPPIPCARPS